MFPSRSSNNPFLLHDPWANGNDVRRDTSRFFASMQAPLPSTPHHGPVADAPGAHAAQRHHAREQHSPTEQHPHHAPQQYWPYAPAGPQAVYPQQYLPAQPPLSANHLPRPQRPPFVPPRVPPPPQLSVPSRPYTYAPRTPIQYAPPPGPPPGFPSSASQHASTVGPAPKVYALSSTGWKDEDKLAFERDNWRA